MGHDSKRQRSEVNDVSLLWRHSSRVHSRTLERAYRRPFLTVLGGFEPQNVVGHRVDPKKALPYVTTRFELSRVKFHARVTSVGESGEKIKLRPIFYVFRQALPYNKFWVTCSYRGRNPLCKVLWGLDSMSGQSFTIPIGLRYCRVNYCSHCYVSIVCKTFLPVTK